MAITLKEHEEAFELKPVGIRYICEFCNEGEMIYDSSENVVIVPLNRSTMIPHKCNKCGKDMKLPKTYPYIEWVTAEEYESILAKSQ